MSMQARLRVGVFQGRRAGCIVVATLDLYIYNILFVQVPVLK
jgi:hypothetical protein